MWLGLAWTGSTRVPEASPHTRSLAPRGAGRLRPPQTCVPRRLLAADSASGPGLILWSQDESRRAGPARVSSAKPCTAPLRLAPSRPQPRRLSPERPAPRAASHGLGGTCHCALPLGGAQLPTPHPASLTTKPRRPPHARPALRPPPARPCAGTRNRRPRAPLWPLRGLFPSASRPGRGVSEDVRVRQRSDGGTGRPRARSPRCMRWLSRPRWRKPLVPRMARSSGPRAGGGARGSPPFPSGRAMGTDA